MKNEILFRHCEASLPSFLSVWKKLVNRDCGSCTGKGIEAAADQLMEEFRPLHPDEMEKIPMENPADGCHLSVVFRGKGKGRVMAAAHLDTVFPVGTAAQRPFSIDGDWARGPGVADCKSGVTMMLFAMKQLQALDFTDFEEIRLFFNGDEEIGSPSSLQYTKKWAPLYDAYLCCESGQEGDGLVRSRKGSSLIRLSVEGIPSHSGNAPEKGSSALMEILHQIQEIKRLEAPEKGTTINFTLLEAGERENVIPAHARATADMRVTHPAEIARIRASLAPTARSVVIPGTKVRSVLEESNPPFEANARTDALICLARQIYGELGRRLAVIDAGGSSDANWAAAAGAATVDGFGAVKGGKNHTPQECASISSVVPRMYLLTRMFMEIGKAAGESCHPL